MNQESILNEVRHWPLADQIQLIDALWSSLADETANDSELSATEKELLIQRLAEDDDQPNEVIAWDDVKSDMLKRLGR